MAANLVRLFTESSPPLGFTAASGAAAANIPSVQDVRNGNFDNNGWSAAGQRRNSVARRMSQATMTSPRPNMSRTATAATARTVTSTLGDVDEAMSPMEAPLPSSSLSEVDEKKDEDDGGDGVVVAELPVLSDRTASGNSLDPNSAAFPGTLNVQPHDPNEPYANGYMFPPKHSFGQSMTIALRSFWRFFLTPVGFLVTIYGLNVVAWGGMLFLVLINASPAMCHPSCSDLNSGGKVWLEIDSQILNALFCVTGLGLIPWRFRDLYYLMQYRIQKKDSGIRRLAGIHNDWFRLQGSQEIPVELHPKEDPIPAGFDDSVFALPVAHSPDAPLTGERAPASRYWKMDFMIWCYVANTLLQIGLCGVMWGFTRFNRPGWSNGLLISLACIVAAAGGFMGFWEGKAVKKIEGVPVSEEDQAILDQRQKDGMNKV